MDARAARDEGIALVTANNKHWMRMAQLMLLVHFPVGWEGIGEDIRLRLEPLLPPPGHHNVWGALVNRCIKLGYLVRTGDEPRNMKTEKSHARHSQVLRRVHCDTMPEFWLVHELKILGGVFG